MLCVSLTQKVSLFQHKNKAISSLAFLPVGKSGACVCPEKPKAFGQASGKLVYHAVANQSVDVGAGAVGFAAGKCAPYPATTMIPGQNPTCDIRHYRGGQWACHHMWSLLDAEQDIPWPDQKLVFHHKYRFWVQPFTEGYHTPVHYGSGSQLLIGSPWEYDVPKCAEGVAGCSRRSDGTWIHTVTGSKYNNEEMVTLNFHCHAPTCLDMSVSCAIIAGIWVAFFQRVPAIIVRTGLRLPDGHVARCVRQRDLGGGGGGPRLQAAVQAGAGLRRQRQPARRRHALRRDRL